jgi:hypothetical protein
VEEESREHFLRRSGELHLLGGPHDQQASFGPDRRPEGFEAESNNCKVGGIAFYFSVINCGGVCLEKNINTFRLAIASEASLKR